MLPLIGWSYCKKITVQTAYLDATLTEFSWGIFAIGDTHLGANAMANGYDIRFTASDGTTLLGHERRYFNIAAGAATGIWFVKTSLATSPATYIYIHYGKAGAPDVSSGPNAYDANFKGVWPGTDITSSTIADSLGISTGNKKAANEPIEEAGPIYKAQHFDGLDDYIDCGDDLSLRLTDNITIEAWLNPDAFPQPAYANPVRKKGSWTIEIPGSATSGYVYFEVATALGTLVAGSWNYVAGSFVSATMLGQKAYLNGVLTGSWGPPTGGARPAGTNLIFGTWQSGGRFFDGLIAEVRLSNVVRSAAWIKFTYYNITEADHEQTWGAEEAAPTGPSIAVVQHHLRMMRGN